MATWGTEIQKAGNFISDAFSGLGRGISDIFGSVKRSIGEIGTFFKNGGTTVVGINVNQIPAMKAAVETYCQEINNALGTLTNYDPTIAFKGTAIEPALKEYIDAVIEACGAIVSNMLAFNDQLTEVQNAYAAKDETSASQIKTSAESTRSSYTTYTSAGSSSN